MSDAGELSSRRDFLHTAGNGVLAASALGIADLALAQAPDAKNVTAPKSKLGWAVVGLGQLAVGEVLPAFGNCEKSRLAGLISGDPEKAARTAQRYAVDPKALFSYENYDTLRDNRDIDIVYICLPNSMHAEYTIRALRAGKHVLCEKPMAVTLEECQSMLAASSETAKKLMIAYRLRYEPFNQMMIDLARKKHFGPIKIIEAENVQVVQAPNIRLKKELGGGPLGDVGVYCLNAARYITGEEPIEVSGMSHQPHEDARFKEVPESVTFLLKFPSGVLAHCSCGFGGQESRRYRVHCEKGWFELDPAFSYSGLRLRTFNGRAVSEIKIDPVNHFAAQMDHFSDCIQTNKRPWTDGGEGFNDMVVMERINQSIADGRTIGMGGG